MTASGQCTVLNCGKELKSKGLCGMHYSRMSRTGSLELVPQPIKEVVEGLVYDQALVDFITARRRRGAHCDGVRYAGERRPSKEGGGRLDITKV